ncbi:MAG: hypothetical protein V4593_02495 [Pseudomonadota bacterium]
MTLATSPSKVHPSGAPAPAHAAGSQGLFSAWQALPVALAALIAFLTLTPDGVAEPLQDFAGWLLVGGVATLAVMAIVTGLNRLLDCEGN